MLQRNPNGFDMPELIDRLIGLNLANPTFPFLCGDELDFSIGPQTGVESGKCRLHLVAQLEGQRLE